VDTVGWQLPFGVMVPGDLTAVSLLTGASVEGSSQRRWADFYPSRVGPMDWIWIDQKELDKKEHHT